MSNESTSQSNSRLKFAIIGLVVLVLGIFAFLVIKEMREEKALARWDEFAMLKEQYEPGPRQDPLFSASDQYFDQRRQRFLTALEEFLPRAESVDDALAPQVHWLIIRTALDRVLSMRSDAEISDRVAMYDKAQKHLTLLTDEYPDFPIHSTDYAPPTHANITRMLEDTVAANRRWDEQYALRSVEPDTAPTILLRTTRGDMRIRPYLEQAPEMARRFIARARSGAYDGTAFFSRRKRDLDSGPLEQSLRAGHPATIGAEPYAKHSYLAFLENAPYEPLVPEVSRYVIRHDRGVVSAWHPDEDTYDGSPQFLVSVGRSPRLDYDYTPIGKLVDDASLETADRIFAQDDWREDIEVLASTEELAKVRTFLQVPVTIVKALVYDESGRVLGPEDTPAPNRVAPADGEQQLSEVSPDEYLADLPPPPDDDAGGDSPDDTEDGAAPGDDGEPGGDGDG